MMVLEKIDDIDTALRILKAELCAVLVATDNSDSDMGKENLSWVLGDVLDKVTAIEDQVDAVFSGLKESRKDPAAGKGA